MPHSRRLFDLPAIGAASAADDDFYYPRALEATFCRDFSCCGLILNDLHDLLQHYEECHVRFEDDEAPADMADGCFFPEEWPADLPFGLTLEQQMILGSTAASTAQASPELLPTSTISPRSTPQLSPSETAASSVISSPLESVLPFPSDMASRKRTATPSAVDSSLPALKRQATRESSVGSPKGLSGSVLGLYDDDIIAAIASATNPLFLSSVASSGKSLHECFSNASLAQAANAAVVAVSGDDDDDEVHLPPSVTAAMAGAVAAAAAAKAHGLLPRDDKPYRCPVSGCDKAYKNPNGLKYHNLHGHCNLAEDALSASKPYKCRVPECYKAYKNLNGLKYHVQHAHCAMIPSLRDLPPNATPAEVAAAVAAAAAAAAATAAVTSSTPSPVLSAPAMSAPVSPARGPMSAPLMPPARMPARASPHSAGLAVSRPSPGSLSRMTSAPSMPLRTNAPPQRQQQQPQPPQRFGAPMSRPHGHPQMPVRRPMPTTQSANGSPVPVQRPRVLPPPTVRRPPTGAPPAASRQPPQATAATC
ncbi:Transcriptional regulator of ribosomal biogenesis proteins [Coemansia sp. RSA 2167]|nr:Transcriptional regulator of ribosomal biogenesis proteins [Coemansia sp. RSA 1752]KAJ1793267.1 Transcriptional regulator of ribosomal biogenesis proteins [Coemansia sp. RSA 2167]KAJ2148754.1 Transcriptional regulator of ribosomal biogenesis proteins [Coemansia sp. RSA 564]KAJ2169800.1 Transcriptional regulator of ribosomal biogenesis proteins [Coemansia sp. RSA 562]KAJ2182804.1 Transcriptional regulator of ribosomal biogenesis proteins [Coemansia sp. RSA 532]KAJ2251107.1 Transcriptional re